MPGPIQSALSGAITTVAGGVAIAKKLYSKDSEKAAVARQTVKGKQEAIKKNREASMSRLLAIQGFKMKGDVK